MSSPKPSGRRTLTGGSQRAASGRAIAWGFGTGEDNWRALRALPVSSGPHRVTVTDVVITEVDTGVGDIHEATVHAVWQALHLRR